MSLRKRTVAVRWAVRRACWAGESGDGWVTMGLKIHIWDSEWRERSAKTMVNISGTSAVEPDDGEGNVAAKMQ